MRIENLDVSDYLQEGDIGFKKPKTKKKRPSRRVVEESDVGPVNGVGDDNKMDVDSDLKSRRERNLDENFVDDDELQASLARARREKTRKVKIMTQEDIAQKREDIC